MVFFSLIRGHICQYVLSEMVLENQDIGNSRQLIQLGGATLKLEAALTASSNLSYLFGHSWPPEMFLQ